MGASTIHANAISAERATRWAPPRVLHVVRSLEVGGLERLVCELVLERSRGTTAVACLTVLGTLGEDLRSQGVSVTALGIEGASPTAVGSLRGLIRETGVQVLHCHNMLAHFYGSLAARLCKPIPVVLSKHGAVIPSGGLSGRINRWLLRRTQVVGVSEEVCELMGGWQLRGSPEVLYIPNGVSLSPYDHLPTACEVRQLHGWPTDDYLVGTVARLSKAKDQVTLLRAFQWLQQRIPRARLVLVGDGPMRSDLEDESVRLGISDKTHFLGERADVPQLLAAMDVFALSSVTEGIPMTILEAMAARLPVVATRVGGIPQVVRDGKTGLLVSPGCPGELARQLAALAANSGLRHSMGRAGRKTVVDEYSAKTMAARYENVYGALLQGAPVCATAQ